MKFGVCYYVLETPKLKYKEGKMLVKILKQKNMELMYLTGKDLASAVESNEKVTIGEDGDSPTLSIDDLQEVLVLIIIPKKNKQDTAFEFEYGLVDPVLADSSAFGTGADEWYWRLYNEHFTSEQGQKVFIIVCTCVGLLICYLFCCLCYCSYYCCCKPKVYTDPNDPSRRFSRRRSSRGASFAAGMRRSMRLESIVSRSG